MSFWITVIAFVCGPLVAGLSNRNPAVAFVMGGLVALVVLALPFLYFTAIGRRLVLDETWLQEVALACLMSGTLAATVAYVRRRRGNVR